MFIQFLKNNLRKGRWMFLLMILFFGLALLCENKYSNRIYGNKDGKRFMHVLHGKEEIAESGILKIKNSLADNAGKNGYSHLTEDMVPLNDQEGISFFVYNNDSLVIWTSNTISFPWDIKEIPGNKFFKIHNTWVLKDSLIFEEFSIYALITIRKEYTYQNRVLKEGFQKDFRFSPAVKIIYPGSVSENPVYDKEGELLFSLDFNHAKKDNKLEFTLCLLMYLFTFLIFLSFLRRFLRNAPEVLRNYIFILVILLLAGVYYLLDHYRFPSIIFNLDLFSPGKFARSPLFPSLGNLTLMIVSVFFLIYNFYLDVFFNKEKLNKYLSLRIVLMICTGMVILFLYIIKTFLIRILIMDSSISFEAYKVLELSAYTFLGFSLIALVFASYALLIDKICGLFSRLNRYREIRIFMIIINTFVFVTFFIPWSGMYPESPVFFLITTCLIYYIRVWKNLRYRFPTFVVFVLVFSVYTVVEVVRFTDIKGREDLRIMAVNLSAEHDPVAELLFVDISKELMEDQDVKDLLFMPYINFSAIYSEIQRKYFSGYLNKFELQITLCRPEDNVYIAPPADSWYPCYDFFYEVIMEDAFEVPNSNFFFLDNMNGRISYFSAFQFDYKGDEIRIFIELNSRLLSEGLGYPELLLEEKYITGNDKDYSYAKYYKGRLITSSGEFSYRMTIDAYSVDKEGFTNITTEGFDHVVYYIDNENAIIVTKQSVHFIDILISFSYVFGFYFFILVIILLLTGISPMITRIEWNFMNRIQFALLAVLFFSLLLTGSGTIYYSITQYKNKHNNNIREKLQSLYVELIHKLEYEQDLYSWESDKYYNLETLLQKFSNVFYSDINLYDEHGWLLASSRPEIFDNGLIGRNMDATAHREMIYNKRSEFIHSETIGKLTYLSAYVPFVNSENNLLAYLNLPYFTRQDELTTEITNLVVAIVNIFVLLTLLTLTFAVFIAGQLSQPLRLIQEHISRFRLSENNEKIKYSGRDEIGSLVNEYNKMIDELQESADKLASSERESAWREMAKQIAHEINNPLTPMRLVVQHLQRSWKDECDEVNREQKLDKISKILLEQIDNLSNIATEFSNFAKMPSAMNDRVNLVVVIKDIIRLFSGTDNITLSIDTGGRDDFGVWADKEQLARVFINLIKNAIQSVPEGKKGLVQVNMEVKDDLVVVKIKDNGKGIPFEIRDKMFQPNFTTKSSGMGMGLAISKNIITTAGGDIRFETDVKRGTLFIVELPLMTE